MAMRSMWAGGKTLAALCCAAGMAASNVAAQKTPDVKATLETSNGTPGGVVTFHTVKKGVKVTLKLENLPIGVHGVHIHANPVCDAPDFKGAGPHFNPGEKMHGFDNPLGHHAGDLPGNVTVGEDHRGEASFVLTDISLDAAATNSITAKGASVVVHEKADDMKTDPSGASGNRIACAVVAAQ